MPTKINILSQVKGMSNKTPCIVATTGDTSFSTIYTIDGITLTNNDRVLVWKQSNATQNGIYIFSGGTLTRALDSNAPDDFIQGMQILVISGDTYGETLFYQTSVVSTIGSSNINFGMFGGLNGTSGTTGTTGSSGESGTNGTSGTSGTSGSSGTSGTDGTSGSSGTSGTSGSSGTSGTSGTSPASQISGSGTVNYIPKFTGTTNLGNSIIYDNGTNVGIGTITPSARLTIIDSKPMVNGVYISSNTNSYNTVLSNSTSYQIGTQYSIRQNIATGSTNQGYLMGMDFDITTYTTSGGFSGTLRDLVGQRFHFGNENGGGNSPTITNAYGIYLRPFYQNGTINNLYALYIGDDASGGILNNYYGIYQQNANAKNYFNGNVGIGTASPNSKLHIKGPLNIERTNTTDYSIIDNEGNLNIKAATGGVGGNFNTVFFTSGTEKMRLNTNGNLGLGVTPSAWSSSWKVMQIGGGTSIAGWGTDAGTEITANAFNDGSWKYIATATAARYQITSTAEHRWSNAPSGTAGSTISFTQAMTLDGNGRLGIGVTSPTYQLQLSIDSAGKPNGGSWANSSDIRLKENIKTIENAIDKICKLRGVTFDWIDETEQGGIKHSGGFIADEIIEIFPEWVTEVNATKKQKEVINDDKVKSLSLPFSFDALLVQAIKELSAEIDILKQEIINLKNK